MSRLHRIVFVAVLSAGLLAGGLFPVSASASASASTEQQLVVGKTPSTAVVPDLAGLDGAAAVKVLKSVGLKWKFSRLVFIMSGWQVTRTKPAAGQTVAAGKKIKLFVVRPTPTAAAADPASPKTSGGLTVPFALTACDQYGQSQYPYGFKLHTILGVIGTSYDPAKDAIFTKVESEVTNQYNATAQTTTECTVTGTNDAPQVIGWLTY